MWILKRKANGLYAADGRSGNSADLGRHSLGTDDRATAVEELKRLDLVKAVEHGHADPGVLKQSADALLPIADGIKMYLDHARRPATAGGVTASSLKRYESVVDKFQRFADEQQIRYWQSVDMRVLNRYATWLDERGYAGRTQYLELTTIKQMVKWLIDCDELPESCRFSYPLHKPHGTDTYCYSDAEVRAMIDHCFANKELVWLGRVIVALVYTGLRISELAQLTWSAVSLEANVLRVIDTTRAARRGRAVQSNKSHRERRLPIHDELKRVLQSLPRTKDGRVLHGPKGGVLKPDTVRNILIRDVLKPLKHRFPRQGDGPAFEDGRLHSFRHYFCSHAARYNIPEQTVKDWLGHADSQMVRHYFHLHDETAQQQMKQLQSVGGPAAPDAPTDANAHEPSDA